MSRHVLIAMLLLASATSAINAHAADDAQSAANAQGASGERDAIAAKAGDDGAKADGKAEANDEVKTLNGISILGNQEAPKSLVIVPWKSSEIGEMPGLSRLLDDAVQPIDKEVFMRELDYYEIRSSSR